MERLTQVINGVTVFTGENYENTTAAELTTNDIRKLLQRLVEYEDTGLTPEQMIEIDQLYAEKCRELADHNEGVIKLAVVNHSPIQVADAICRHYLSDLDTKVGLIALEELSEHIDAITRAEWKLLEVRE